MTLNLRYEEEVAQTKSLELDWSTLKEVRIIFFLINIEFTTLNLKFGAEKEFIRNVCHESTQNRP